MSFTYENQGNNTYLVYKIGASDNVDTMSLGMITNNKIDGIVPTLFTQSDTDRFIKYNISAKVSAKEFLSGVVNKKRLLGVFISVLKAIKSTEEYMIDARSLLIDLEHIYVDVSKCDAMLVCLPLVRQNESVNIPMFFKQIMFSTQFDQNENCDYVAQIINYLNSTPVFSVDAFEKLLMDIDADNLNIAASKAVAGQQKPVQPQSQSQSQQPKPMQPAMNQLKNTQVQTNMPSQGKMQSQRETQSANNVVQPNQVNFAVPNMNPQNQNRINNNVQMGTNISGTYVETTSEKQMSMFGLLTHYSKENKQIYERQKAQRKAQKEAEKKRSSNAWSKCEGIKYFIRHPRPATTAASTACTGTATKCNATAASTTICTATATVHTVKSATASVCTAATDATGTAKAGATGSATAGAESKCKYRHDRKSISSTTDFGEHDKGR